MIKDQAGVEAALAEGRWDQTFVSRYLMEHYWNDIGQTGIQHFANHDRLWDSIADILDRTVDLMMECSDVKEVAGVIQELEGGFTDPRDYDGPQPE